VHRPVALLQAAFPLPTTFSRDAYRFTDETSHFATHSTGLLQRLVSAFHIPQKHSISRDLFASSMNPHL
jgi:hypothetical protein